MSESQWTTSPSKKDAYLTYKEETLALVGNFNIHIKISHTRDCTAHAVDMIVFLATVSVQNIDINISMYECLNSQSTTSPSKNMCA